MIRLFRSRFTASLLVIFLMGAAGRELFRPGNNPDVVELDVTEGMTAGQVATILVNKGGLRSVLVFKGWVVLRRAGSRLKVGRYRFPTDRSAFWMVDDLINARTLKIKVVIPEGFASWQIAERLQENQVTEAEAFKSVVKNQEWEGFLYPATYDFDVGLKAESAAVLMKARFDQAWTEEFERRAAELGLTKKEAVTLASIIEREGRAREEFPLISAVYTNRLKKNMRLEADPTVQYALGYWKSRLLYSDYTNVKSPYNTYLKGGLPPGPICSPGAEAIRAALWPADSEALYFIAQEDGRHSFSSNYREHTIKVNQRNRKKRLKGQNHALHR